MDDDRNEGSWQRLVEAARGSGADQDLEPETEVPERFVTRMRTLRDSLWVFAKSYLWRRWSLAAVAVALLLYLIAFLLLKQDPAPSIAPPAPPTPLSP